MGHIVCAFAIFRSAKQYFFNHPLHYYVKVSDINIFYLFLDFYVIN